MHVDAPELDPARLRERILDPVEVAVIDTGIDAAHPDLRGRVRAAFRVERSGGRLRVAPRSATACNDVIGHGTAISSVIAEIAPNAQLVDLEIASVDPVGTGTALLEALRFAIERGSPVINLSLACSRKLSGPLAELCELAYFRDLAVVAARRNMPLADLGLPAELSSCLGVEATSIATPYDLRFRPRHPIEFSARGGQMIVAAPGGKYTVQHGTSLATSTVSGLCALYLGERPSLAPYELKSLLKRVAATPG